MKKFFFFLSAIALLGLASACVEQQEVNPNYNPETREVNANFVFNIATNDSPTTKMTADDVQYVVSSAAKFRGINNAHLIALTLGNNTNKIAVGGEPVTKSYNLQEILAAGSLRGTATTGDKDKSHRVLELTIPTGVNNFVFFGKAIKGSGENVDNEQGKIVFTVDENSAANTQFELVSRYDKKVDFEGAQQLIAAVVNNILTKPTAKSGNTDYYWKNYGVYNSQAAQGERWKVNPQSITDRTVPASPLAEVLGNIFCSFVNIRPGAVRAGSGQSVVRMMGDIAVSLGQVAKATATTTGEELAKGMARAILTEMNKYFYITKPVNATVPEEYKATDFMALDADFENVGTDAEDVRWRPADEVKTNTGITINNVTVTTNFIRFFPTEFNMPMGAAQLVVDDEANATFKYAANPSTFNGAMPSGIDLNKVMYPAELCYFGNSPLRVTDETLDEKDYPDGAGSGEKEWLADASWTGKNWSGRGAEVLSSSRSVAMADNINYGTALLEATVGYASTIGQANPLIDNTQKFFPGENPRINLANPGAGLFYLTGVLIGGQYKTMGWNYIAKADLKDNANYIIYDKIADPIQDKLGADTKAIQVPANGGVSAKNYTLVWDNYNNTDGEQDKVLVALEFVNNTGHDFWGEHNIIRKGGTFYILGELDLSKATAPTASSDGAAAAPFWPVAPDNYVLPPYNTDGTSKEIKRVFIQDYRTVANFKIGPKSLQHAYVTVPDLRSSQMSLGLSVDLQWRQGDTFDVLLGGE